MVNRDWKTASLAAAALLVVGGSAYAIGRAGSPSHAAASAPTSATLTVIGATATIYGASATEIVVGEPMPLSNLTDTVVVVIEATDPIGSCEIRVNGQLVIPRESTSAGHQTACVWNRLKPVG